MNEENNQDNSMEKVVNAVAMEVLKALAVDENKKDVESKINSVLEVVAGLKNDLVKNATDLNSTTTSQLYDALVSVEKMLKNMVADGEKRCISQIEKIGNELRFELAQVQSQIPDPKIVSTLESKVENLPLISLDDVEKALPQFGAATRNGLELLQGNDRLDKKAIKGLEEAFEELRNLIYKVVANSRGGGGRTGTGVMFYDLSTFTNGTLKVFTVPKGRNAIILGSDFPTVLMEGNGFTLNATRTQATLTVTNAPSAGSQLLFQYTPLFN